MTINVSHMFIPVHDPDEALGFYDETSRATSSASRKPDRRPHY
jgi:hypothetical protein